MTAKPADEKRQEERRIKELREFQRSSPANRRCFDCNEMMPQYVCLDFNTFVCTSCSGIHREFAHRVKSISMSKFTETEVKNMIKFGGNDAAQKYWRSKHDPSFRPNGGTDGERTRNFIRLTYVDRKWVYESPRHASKTDDQPQASSSKSSKSASKPAPRNDDFFSDGGGFDAFGSNDAPSGKGNEGFASFGDFSAFENKTATAQPSQGFGDFGAFSESSAASPAAAPTPAPAQGFDDFGSFDAVSSSASTPAAPARQEFASFKIAPPPDFQFSPASSTVASTPVRDNTHTKSSNDFLAFSPENKKSSDPFTFDEPGAAATTTSSTASPFDAFGAPAPPNVSATPSFDAFGGSSAPSPFDAFGAAAPSSSSGAAPVDPFGGKPASNLAGSGLDVFGTPNTRSQSNSALDPFGGFSAGASSGTSKPEPAKPIGASVDPFAAFDGLDSVATTAPSSDPNTSSFTSAQNGGAQLTSFPPVGGSGLPNQPAQPTPSSDPFAFASGESATKTSSFGMAGGSTAPPNRTNSSGQGFAAFPQPQPTHQLQPQVNVSMPGYNPNAFMQQQHQAAPQQWFGQQHPSFPGGYVQPQQTMPGAFHPPPTAVPSRESSSSQLKTVSGSAASINDPFASLSISNTFGGSNTGSTNPGGPGSAPGSRGASFEHQQPLSSASPAAPFAFPTPPGNPMVGVNAPFGNPSGGSAPGSRGQSFQSAQPMGGMASSSPASSFSFPPQAASVPLQPSQSPMGSFSFPNQAGTAAPAPSFGAFQSSGNTSRPNSFTGAPAQPPPPSANPFDMF